jgi:hypothetical protein
MAKCVELHSKEALIEGLKSTVNSDMQVYVFTGQRRFFTQGPLPYLLDPPGEPVPLFDVPNPAEAEIADDGYMGEPVDEPEEFEDEEEVEEEDGDYSVYSEEFDEDEEEIPEEEDLEEP